MLSILMTTLSRADAQETNLERLERVYEALFDSVWVFQPQAELMIKSSGTAQPINWLIEKAAISSAQKHGTVTLRDSTAQNIAVARLEYCSLTVLIRYDKADKTNYRRQVTVQLYLKFVSSEGVILFAEKLTKTSEDLVNRKRITDIESENLPFTHGKLPHSARKWAEPVAASALTALIIYLFYFYRSH